MTGKLPCAVCALGEVKEGCGCEVRGLWFSRDGPGLQKLDLTDREQVAAVFADFNPTAVVHWCRREET